MKKPKETPKGNQKDKLDLNKKNPKQGKNVKDLFPANSPHLKNLREQNQVNNEAMSQEEIKEIKDLIIISKPDEIFPEWPDEETLKAFNLEQETNKEVFTDEKTKNILLPCNFEETKWVRPEDYLRNIILNKEIKISFPNKNLSRVRNSAKEFYQKYELPSRKKMEELNQQQEDNINIKSNTTVNDSINTITIGDQKENFEQINKKRYLYRDLITILDKRIDMKIVNIKLRNETDEETQLRKELEAEEKLRLEKEAKGKRKTTVTSPSNKNNKNQKIVFDENDPAPEEIVQIKEISPSDIYNDSDINYLPYIKWLMSIFQMLKDLNVKDCLTKKTIINNIYPQKDDIPCISKSGKYWVKLYFMGKARKIEIDDLMPCNKNEDFILPSCFKLSELWPAIFTKAIFKIHSAKRMNIYTEEVGDISILYNLTGYISEKIPASSSRINQLTNYLCSKENYLNKFKLFAAIKFENEKITLQNKSNFKPKKEILLSSNQKRQSNKNVGFLNGILSKGKTKRMVSRIGEDSLMSNEISETINENQNAAKGGSRTNLMMNILKKKKPAFLSDAERRKKSVNFDSSKTDIASLISETGKEIKEEESENNQDNNSEFNSVANNETQIQGNHFYNQHKKELDIINENVKTDHQESPPEIIKKGYGNFIKNIKKGVLFGEKKGNSSKELFSPNKKNENNSEISINENNNPEKDLFSNKENNKDSPNKTTKDLVNCKIELNDKPVEKRDDILENYLYPIIDFFENKKFNMTRLKPIDFSDIKRYGKDEKIPGIYKQLSKEDKKKYLENLVQIKNKQKEMKDERIKDLKDDGKKYNFIKIVNCTIGIPHLDFFIPFSDFEITISKKCIENNWDFPPPDYYEKYLNLKYEDFHDSEHNTTKKKSTKKLKKVDQKTSEYQETETNDNINLETKKSIEITKKPTIKINTWNKDIYLSIIDNNLAMYENCIEPFNNYNGGIWMPFIDFKKNFNFYILLHNQKSFKNFLNCDNLWHNTSDCFEYNESTAVIYLNNFIIEKENSLDKNNEEINYSQIQNLEKDIKESSKFSNLMILFEPNNTSDLEIPQFFDLLQYVNFDLIDSFGNIIQPNIFLSKFHSCYYNDKLEKEKNYFLLLRSFVCPFGYNFSVFSDHELDKMDYGTYLKKFNNFHSKLFNVDHPSFEKNSYSLFAKFKVKIFEKTYFRLKLKHEDKLLKKFVEIWLHFGKNSQVKKRLNFDLNEKILFDPLENDDEYLFAFIINPAYSTNKGNLEIDFSYDNDSTIIEQIEQIEPVVINDKVKFDKYGTIFKEFFISGENTYITLNIDINLIKNKQEDVVKSPRKVDSVSGFFNGPGNDENLNLKIFRDNEIRLRMKIKVLKGEEVIYEEEFFNRTCVQNILLNENLENYNELITENLPISPKNQNKKNSTSIPIPIKEYPPYKIICNIDSNEEKISREILDNLEWSMKIYANDVLGVSVDTEKEDSEKSLKDNWEEEEQGRSEKANKSRIRHLLMIKKRSGKLLTPEEEHILKEQRPRTVSTFSMMNKDKELNSNNQIVNQNQNKKEGNLKEKEKEKKNTNDNLNKNNKKISQNNLPLQTEESEKINNFMIDENRPVIVNPEQHKCKFIKKFLTYTEQERLVKKDQKKEEHKKLILTESTVKRKQEEINSKYENFHKAQIKEGDESINKSILEKENLKGFYKTTNTFRVQVKDNCSNLFKQRDNLRMDLIKNQDIEGSLNDLMESSNIDFAICANVYKEAKSSEGVNPKLIDKFFYYVSSKKDEFYRTELKKLTVKDKKTVHLYMDDIKENKWNISREVISKFEDLLSDEPIKKK